MDEVPAEGVVISARAFRGALTTMIREFNHLVLNNGFKPHIWAVLYLSPKEPELGDTVKKDHFLTLKDLEEHCK